MSLRDLWRRWSAGRRRALLNPGLQEALDGFQARIDYRFSDPGLLCWALTHRSYLNCNGEGMAGSNERLEFLGDSVLELVVNDFLYHQYPDFQEGDLTKMKSLLVSRSVLAEQAKGVDLGRFIFLSDAERESGGASRSSILADGFEAVVGALYLDGGLSPASHFIRDNLLGDSDRIFGNRSNVNYKSLLQEHVQERHKTYPRYRTVQESGPDHRKIFTVEVTVKGERLGIGKGTNKKNAEQAGAQNALEKLGLL
jgi:ribonuclease-3